MGWDLVSHGNGQTPHLQISSNTVLEDIRRYLLSGPRQKTRYLQISVWCSPIRKRDICRYLPTQCWKISVDICYLVLARKPDICRYLSGAHGSGICWPPQSSVPRRRVWSMLRAHLEMPEGPHSVGRSRFSQSAQCWKISADICYLVLARKPDICRYLSGAHRSENQISADIGNSTYKCPKP